MEKQLFEQFISRYNLAGSVESVLINADADSVTTRFITDDKHVLGTVKTTAISIEEGEYGIYNTSQLRSLLSILDKDITIKVVKTRGTPTGLLLSDDSAKVTYVLADKTNIPSAPDLKTLPPFEITIALDDKFISTFIRAKNALPDVETCTLLTTDTRDSIVIGYNENINTNRVAIDLSPTKSGNIDALSFSAKYIKEILSANKDMKGTLRISSKGLAHIEFKSNTVEANYYVVKIDRQD